MASLYWKAVFLLCWVVAVSVARRRQLTNETEWTQTKDQERGKAFRGDFWCPTCQEPSEESCDAKLTNTTCPKAEFCMVLWDRKVFARKCVNRKMLDLLTEDCSNVGPNAWECKRRIKPYHLSWCEQSGCKAEAPEAVNKEVKDEFWCPTCQSSSQQSCDSTLVNTTCPKAELCMALRDENIFVRKCINRKMLHLLTKDCSSNVEPNAWECKRRKKPYHLSWCEQSGCKAKAPKAVQVNKSIKDAFWCPTCQSSTKDSCDSTLANTTCPKAELCMALRDENIFVRKCVNRKMLELLTKDCRNVDSEEWVCNGKRQYHMTFCERSGCRAEFSQEIKDHLTTAFWCPTCQSTSEESCAAAFTNTTCPKADFCMALWDKNVFARKCINRKMLKLLTKNCKHEGSMKWKCNRKRKYHVTVCDQPGCIAEVSGHPIENEIPQETPFECPTCPIRKTSQECDDEMTMTECPMATRCMVLRVNGTAEVQSVFARSCVNERIFNMIQRACTNRQGCEIASCTQSRCRAMP